MKDQYVYKNLETNPFYMELARTAYQHYGAVTDFKNFQGSQMPDFDVLPDTIKRAWHDASRYCFNQGSESQARKYGGQAGCGSCSG